MLKLEAEERPPPRSSQRINIDTARLALTGPGVEGWIEAPQAKPVDRLAVVRELQTLGAHSFEGPLALPIEPSPATAAAKLLQRPPIRNSTGHEAASTVDGSDAMRAYFVRYAAERDLELYARTGERALVLRVWIGYRQAGIAVPERVAKIIDEWASEPISARSAKTILMAERELDVVHNAFIRQYELGQRPGEADVETAVQFGMTAGSVRTRKSRWKAGLKPSASSSNGQSDAPSLESLWAAVVTEKGEVT